jgi:hypothetical protein
MDTPLALLLKANPGHETEVAVMAMIISFVIAIMGVAQRKRRYEGPALFKNFLPRQPSQKTQERVSIFISLISLCFGISILISLVT